MDNVKDDRYYTDRIVKDLKFIELHMTGVELEELTHDEVLLDSMLFRMIQISENAKRLTDKYKASRSEVPWIAMTGFRNRIVHDYGNVDLNVIFDTLKYDVPNLLRSLT